MNGYENFYAGAFFFALMTFGALLKLDATIGWTCGAVCAVAGAVCLRIALNKSAQAAEEDHQRMEIQFQQLRTKIIETSAATVEAMNSVNDAAQFVQENLPIIRVRLAELDSLSKLVETAEAIRSAVEVLDENFSALNVELEKISVAIREQGNSSAVAEELKNLTAIADANKSSLQTVTKLLQLVGQMLKNQPYDKDLNSINATLDKLIKTGADNRKADLQNIVKHLQLLEQTLKNRPYAKDLSSISATLNKLVEVTADAAKPKESALTEQDLSLLKQIAAKIKIR